MSQGMRDDSPSTLLFLIILVQLTGMAACANETLDVFMKTRVMYSESTYFVQKSLPMDKDIFKPDYPFIDSNYLGDINDKNKEIMTQFYYFLIRYYDRSPKGRKRYYSMQSPYFRLSAFCEIEMRDKMFELSRDYEIDSYSIQSVWLDPTEVICGKLEIREF